MEKFLSNDAFRNMIFKIIISNAVSGENANLELDEKTHVYFATQKLLEMYNSENMILENIFNGILETCFLDTIKVLNLKNRESRLEYDEIEIYNRICSIGNFEELENAIFTMDNLFEDLLNYTLEFYRYNIFRKIKAVKSLSASQSAMLLYNFKLFENDYEEYSNNLNLNTILNYYKKEMKVYEMTPMDTGAISANLSEEITGFIKNLAGIDFDSFETLMEEIIKTDYKWSKYIVDSKMFNNIVDIGDFEEKIDMFENNSIDSLIVEELLTDDYYLNSLIDGIILTKCDNLYVSEDLLNEDIVNDYYTKTLKPMK